MKSRRDMGSVTHSSSGSANRNGATEGDVQAVETVSAPGGTRTHDLRVKSPLLYQLSYRRASLLPSKPTSLGDACHRHGGVLGVTHPG
jgi:hypothetical protein